MIIFDILMLFIIPANIMLLFLVAIGLEKRINRNFLLLISYGVAPILSGLLFYYLILFFPKRNANLYIFLVLLVWSVIAVYSRGKIKELYIFYKGALLLVGGKIFSWKFVFYLIVLFFTFLFSIQAFLYPISEGDSAYYFLQSEALHQSLNAYWYDQGGIMINDVNEYYNNDMIRPGIPSSMAFMFLFGQREDNYLAFTFFFVYCYYLLMGMFLLVVSRLAIALKMSSALPKIIALLFFVFYWNMTRFYIFNNKEVVIYLFALAGLYLISNLASIKKRSIQVEVLLGVVLGLNSFVNSHGIIIGIFSLIILFVFSKLSFWQRTQQFIFVFCINLIFSAFEFVEMFGFIFLDTFRNLCINNSASSVVLTHEKQIAAQHIQMYQTDTFKEIYLKGKLQLITNIGSYGFYFLSFIAIVALKLKAILSSTFGKIILSFMAIYYFVIIDPLNLNKNPLAIVLWGSPKYSMFIVLLAIIIVSIYFNAATENLFRYIYRRKIFISMVVFAFLVLLYIFKERMIALGLVVLLGVIKVDRGVSFYADKVALFYFLLLGLVAILVFFMLVFHLKNISEQHAYKFFLVFCLIFMIIPFFIVNPGKVPLGSTLSLLNKNRTAELESVIYFGDLFKVYNYAVNILPRGTFVKTSFLETYTYNDYLNLRGGGNLEAKYEIAGNCLESEKIYSAGDYSLCKIKNNF